MLRLHLRWWAEETGDKIEEERVKREPSRFERDRLALQRKPLNDALPLILQSNMGVINKSTVS